MRLDHFRGALHYFDGGAGIFPRDGNVSRAAEMRAEKRDLEQAALGQKTELHRDVGERDRCIHIALMVGYENVACRGVDVFESFHADSRAANGQKSSCPAAGDANLQRAGRVEKGDNEADSAVKNSSENDGGIGKEYAAQPLHACPFYETDSLFPDQQRARFADQKERAGEENDGVRGERCARFRWLRRCWVRCVRRDDS